MNLYIKQKVFSFGDKFTVKDESGADRYFIEAKIFSFGDKLTIYDAAGRPVARIEQELFRFMPRYNVFVGDRHIAQIVKEFTFFKPSYRVEGLGWEVKGSFLEHDYTINSDKGYIATISKQWMTWGDTYELNISNPEDEIAVLAVVIAIDCVMAAADSSAAD